MSILHDVFQYRDRKELYDGFMLVDCNILKDFGEFKAGEMYDYVNIYYPDELVIAYTINVFGKQQTIKQTKFKITPA